MAAETPTGFSSGQVTITAATPTALGPLIQAQIDKNAAMAAFLVVMQADSGNAAPVLFGMDTTVGTSKYGFSLAAGLDRQFGGGTGNNVLVGRWFVYSTSSAVLHIEIMP